MATAVVAASRLRDVVRRVTAEARRLTRALPAQATAALPRPALSAMDVVVTSPQ